MTRRRLRARGSVVNAAQASRRDAKLVDSVADHEPDFSVTLLRSALFNALGERHT